MGACIPANNFDKVAPFTKSKKASRCFFFPILLQHRDKSETSGGKIRRFVDLRFIHLPLRSFSDQTRTTRSRHNQPTEKFPFLLVRQHLNGSIKGRPLLQQTVFDWENQELFILVMFSQVTLQAHVCNPLQSCTPPCPQRNTNPGL